MQINLQIINVPTKKKFLEWLNSTNVYVKKKMQRFGKK